MAVTEPSLSLILGLPWKARFRAAPMFEALEAGLDQFAPGGLAAVGRVAAEEYDPVSPEEGVQFAPQTPEDPAWSEAQMTVSRGHQLVDF